MSKSQNKTEQNIEQNSEKNSEQNSEQIMVSPEAAIEAVLFAAGHPVAYTKLSDVIGISVRDIKNLIVHMQPQFEHRGLQLLDFAETCQLATKEEYAPYIREALGIRRGGNLSASSMEVLSIIAYNQPTTRSFVDSIRGADSSYAMSSLLDKELIESAGRLDAPGRPMLYVTTDKFLRVFGLHSLSDLPQNQAADLLKEQTAQQETLPIDAKTAASDTESTKTDKESKESQEKVVPDTENA